MNGLAGSGTLTRKLDVNGSVIYRIGERLHRPNLSYLADRRPLLCKNSYKRLEENIKKSLRSNGQAKQRETERRNERIGETPKGDYGGIYCCGKVSKNAEKPPVY